MKSFGKNRNRREVKYYKKGCNKNISVFSFRDPILSIYTNFFHCTTINAIGSFRVRILT